MAYKVKECRTQKVCVGIVVAEEEIVYPERYTTKEEATEFIIKRLNELRMIWDDNPWGNEPFVDYDKMYFCVDTSFDNDEFDEYQFEIIKDRRKKEVK